uniref:U3 small nucleolar RNA-associated protein 25 n=1 Tax=Rhizophora mucronata TaxID=61149 RepID=A0A2P2MEI4_RHIMU
MTPQTYKVNVEHFDRFIDEFGVQVEENSGNKSSKPSDYQALFVDKNNDDNFMLGIKFTRSCIKLYSDFYSSDMIVASPLKLHDKIAKAEINNEIDVDYLSSIEVLIIDHADLITMQNWAFLSSVLDHLNCIPSKQHGTDIMRIRKWYLEGYARLYRQTIVLSYYVNPGQNLLPSLFFHYI